MSIVSPNLQTGQSETSPLPHESTLAERQDDVMATISDDGRPPAKGTRRREWTWFVGLALVAAVIMVIWGIAAGVQLATAWAAIALGVGFLVFASPVIIVGRMRAKEEAIARGAAVRRETPSRLDAREERAGG